jgi:hypothetical protein
MSLPPDAREPAVSQVERYCEQRAPVEARSEIRIEYSVRGSAITIVERRPPWSELVGLEWSTTRVAQLRYDSDSGRSTARTATTAGGCTTKLIPRPMSDRCWLRSTTT